MLNLQLLWLLYCLKEFNHENLKTSDYSFIRSWIVSLVESGLTNRSVNRKISVLRSYFNFLLKIGEIEKNPLKILVIYNFLAILDLIQNSKVLISIGDGLNNFWLSFNS